MNEQYASKQKQIESKYNKRMEGRKVSSPDGYTKWIKSDMLMGMKYRQCPLQSCCILTDVDGKQWTDTGQGP